MEMAQQTYQQDAFFWRNYCNNFLYRGYANTVVSRNPDHVKYYAEHQARTKRANSLQSICESSQFADSTDFIPCDISESDNELLGDLFEHDESFDVFESDPVDTSAVTEIEPQDTRTCLLTPPLPKRESTVKQKRGNPEHEFCELNSAWLFDENDFLAGNADIASLQVEDTTCARISDCAQVSVPLLTPPTEEFSNVNSCSDVRAHEFAANVSTVTSVGHFPEREKNPTATDMPTTATKRRRLSPSGLELDSLEKQELLPKPLAETAQKFDEVALSRKRPFKNVREKRRRDVIKEKYDGLYNLCQNIAAKTGIIPLLGSEDDRNKSKKSRQKLEILGGVIELMQRMEKDLIELRVHNKRLKSHFYFK